MGSSSSSTAKRATDEEPVVSTDFETTAQPALQIMNSFLKVYFRPLVLDVVNNTKDKPMDMENGYKFKVMSGELTAAPHLKRITPLQTGDRGEATPYIFSFNMDVVYEGRPKLKAVLESTGIQPNLYFDVKSFSVDAKVHAEMSPGLGYVAWYFLERPSIVWDLEVQLTEQRLDVPGESLVAEIFESYLNLVDQFNPFIASQFGTMEETDPEKYKRLRKIALDTIATGEKSCLRSMVVCR